MRFLRSSAVGFTFFILFATRLHALDNVRAAIGSDAATAQFGVTGKGVIVAILDRGLDYRHPDFRNPDGTTRILSIFDLTDDSGANAADNPYRVGTIYSKAQIDDALVRGVLLATRDAVGHGTTTTGLAAGNGSANSKYRGIAPNASLIIVKVTSDGAPAHDGETAEAAYYKPERLPIAIDFVADRAKALKMPCVMLLNLGSIGGPTDGTSALARKIDATVGAGKPGILFVTGPGDDGGQPNRAAGTVRIGETQELRVRKGASGSLTIDLWYSEADRMDVVLTSPGGATTVLPAPASNSTSATTTGADFLYYHLGSAVDFSGAQNQKREIWLRLNGPTGDYKIELRGTSVVNGHFDATMNPSAFYNDSKLNFFQSHVAAGSIWDGATAHNNISPNSYVIRTSWIDLDGVTRTISGEGAPGELWRGSSTGPTFDGRLGVDVSAPGDRVVTTYSATSYWATFRFNMVSDGGGRYGIAGAVSAAAPTVTGVLALMLEANPKLDAPTAKSVLQRTARKDQFTGSTPNPNWGYGKIDARAAVALARELLGRRRAIK